MRRPGASREGGTEQWWQHPVKIDGCPRQNSAYRPGRRIERERIWKRLPDPFCCGLPKKADRSIMKYIKMELEGIERNRG